MSTTTEPAAAPDSELFDGTQYDLPIPKLDGHKADVLRVAISGTIDLDLYDNDSLAWLNTLKLGREHNLAVTVRVTGSAWRHTLKGDDHTEHVVHQAALKIVGLEIPKATE